MGYYTKRREDAIWHEKFEPESCENLQIVVDYLNSNEFRSFGEGLTAVINNKFPDQTDLTAISIVKDACAKNGIGINEIASENTLKNWFNCNGERPKKGDADRQKMFVLAFALNLSVEETKYLFNRVFLDRSFNFRNVREFVYYYCLKNSKPYSTAKSIISRINFIAATVNDATVYTSAFVESMPNFDDEALLEYINTHPHNFKKNNISAIEQRNRLIDCAVKDIENECQYDQLRDSMLYRRRNGMATEKLKEITVNEMYEHITGQSMDKSSGTSSVFKNVMLPKEIKSSFPEAAMFTKKEPTSDELRKMIVMLFSYGFWCRMQYAQFQNGVPHTDVGFDDYIEQIDSLLDGLGFSVMYPGNPHDWLYCYCTTAEHPLDMFREILSTVLHPKD